jgi:hypothetical protein
MSLRIHLTIEGKCRLHPRYNPARPPPLRGLRIFVLHLALCPNRP